MASIPPLLRQQIGNSQFYMQFEFRDPDLCKNQNSDLSKLVKNGNFTIWKWPKLTFLQFASSDFYQNQNSSLSKLVQNGIFAILTFWNGPKIKIWTILESWFLTKSKFCPIKICQKRAFSFIWNSQIRILHE